MKIRLTLIVTLVTFTMALIGCQSNRDRFNNPQTSTTTTKSTEASGTSFLLDASAFDLETVVALIKDGALEDMQALEKEINDTESAINNVDIDGDGNVDFIAVEETRGDDGKMVLSFIAYPSSDPDNEEGYTTVAEVSVSQNTTTKEVEISGGYPDYVSGYDSHYYHTRHSGMSMGDAIFLSWLLTPSRPLYYGYGWGYYDSWYYGGGGYYSRPVQNITVINSTRSSYGTSTGISSSKSSVSTSSRPSTYKSTSTKATSSSYAKSSRSSSSSTKSATTNSGSSSRSSGSSTKSSGSSGSSRSSGSARKSGSSSRSRGSSGGGK